MLENRLLLTIATPDSKKFTLNGLEQRSCIARLADDGTLSIIDETQSKEVLTANVGHLTKLRRFTYTLSFYYGEARYVLYFVPPTKMLVWGPAVDMHLEKKSQIKEWAKAIKKYNNFQYNLSSVAFLSTLLVAALVFVCLTILLS